MAAEANGTQPGAISVEVPEYLFEINPDAEGNPQWIGLVVRSSGQEVKSFLCRATTAEVELVNRAFNRELSRVINTLRRTGKGLIVAKGVDSNVLRAEKHP